jgi:hypothetical protein
MQKIEYISSIHLRRPDWRVIQAELVGEEDDDRWRRAKFLQYVWRVSGAIGIIFSHEPYDH